MKRAALATCLLVFAIPACDDDNGDNPLRSTPLLGSGVIVSESRSVPTFDSVDLRAVASVSVSVGGPQNVRIETDDNIMPHIFTRVSGAVLHIETDVDYTTSHGVDIALDMNDVQHLQLTGVGTIASANIASSGSLGAALPGVGTITLSGTADTFNGSNSGVGLLDAEGLVTRLSTIVASGVGNCRITVTERLDVTISGPGNVYYAGNPPVVNSTITGTGRLIPI